MGWKEKSYREKQRNKSEDNSDHMREEMLRMQGLILCKDCIMPYSVYQPICPHCSEPNKTHYPAKV
jgi:predicted amidophosphoribosyltransferase